MTSYGLPASQLIEAIRSGSLIMVINAIDDGGDINEPDVHGVYGLPLRTACFMGNLAIVRELLSHGANPNVGTSDGPGAPLRLALRCKHYDVAALLLQEGATVPDGISIDPAVYAISCAPLAIEASAPSLPIAPDANTLEYSPSEIMFAEAETDFGTQTNALGTDLLFLDEDLSGVETDVATKIDIDHLSLEPWPEKPSNKS